MSKQCIDIVNSSICMLSLNIQSKLFLLPPCRFFFTVYPSFIIFFPCERYKFYLVHSNHRPASCAEWSCQPRGTTDGPQGPHKSVADQAVNTNTYALMLFNTIIILECVYINKNGGNKNNHHEEKAIKYKKAYRLEQSHKNQ